MNNESFVLALVVAVLWGVQAVIYKHLLRRFDKQTIMSLTSIFYVVVLLGYNAFTKNQHLLATPIQKLNDKLTRLDVLLITISSVLCLFVANIIYYTLLASPDNASAIVTAITFSSPLFTLLIGYMFLGEKVNLRAIVGILLTVMGLVLIATDNTHHLI